MASREKKPPAEHKDSGQSEIVRRFKANPFLFIGTVAVLALVIVSFVVVPAIVPNAGGGMSADLTFGSYNKVPITYVPGNYFAEVHRQVASYYQSYININPDNEQIVAYQIWRQAFEEAAVHTAMLDEMKQAGFTAPAKVVDREVAKNRLEEYQQADKNSQLSIWRQVRDSIAAAHYWDDFLGLRTSSKQIKFITAMASPQRRFDMAVFPSSRYPDGEILSYVGANPDSFRVTQLSKITISAGEKEAQQILASVKEGTTTFEDAAKTNSQDAYAERGGDMGIKLVYELVSEIPDEAERGAVVNLARGDYSEVVKVPAGWAFFRAEAAPAEADTADEATLKKIRGYITGFERGRVEDWLFREAQEFAAAVRNDDFDGTLSALGIEKRSFGPLPVNYGNVDLFPSLRTYEESAPELSAATAENETFWRAAFSVPLNTPSEPLVLGDNVVVLYPLEESAADENFTGSIEFRYADWLSKVTMAGVRNQFLSSEKLDDKFADTFIKRFWNTN